MGNSWKAIGTLAACFVLSVSCVAVAQPQADTSESTDPVQAGYRVATQSDGFQLVEHGVWSRAPVALQTGFQHERTPRSVALLEKGKANSHRPSSFRRASFLPHIYAAEAQFALPPGLLDALVWTESRYNPFAISKAGAVGLGQLMPGTAKDLGVTNRYDPRANIFGAARYLRHMIDKFGVVHLALAAYNAGPRAVERAGGIPRNGETPMYVQNVLRNWLN